MTTPKSRTGEFATFFATMLEELMAVPDEQLLEGTEIQQLRNRRTAIVNAAKKTAGGRRMAAAKAQVSAHRARPAVELQEAVDAAVARRYIAQVANDPRYTLAARNLSQVSDDEAIALYRRIKDMEKAAGGEAGDSGR
jgi:hypothetical protein